MPRRYRSKGSATKKRSSIRRAPRARSRARSRTPGWHWLLTGMTLGGLGVVFLNMNQVNVLAKPSSFQQSAASEHYEFYQLLGSGPSSGAHKTKPSESIANETVKAQVSPLKPPSPKGKPTSTVRTEAKNESFRLQAAAFANEWQATHLKQRIESMGLPATIHKVVQGSKRWYRVMVTPVHSEKEALAYQDKLSKIGLDAQLIW